MHTYEVDAYGNPMPMQPMPPQMGWDGQWGGAPQMGWDGAQSMGLPGQAPTHGKARVGIRRLDSWIGS